MADSARAEYEVAVRQLNGLYRSERLMNRVHKERTHFTLQQIPDLHKLLKALSITQADLDELRIIHVAGTKGKGSTCAFIESIIRHCGYKTLLFSSPHVREVRERILLNGEPLPYASFATYFWEIYNQLKHLKNEDNSLMHYFNFLVAMGVYVAIKEKLIENVDAVIMEGMLGGEFDYTNIFNNKVVCGVTSLGLDHIAVLGGTIEEIAWHKGGIFSKDVPAFTSPQPEEALQVLMNRATEKGTVLSLCPSLDQFGSEIGLGVGGAVQKLNAAIALQLARTWLERRKQLGSPINYGADTNTVPARSTVLHPITTVERKGLQNCHSMGKDHIAKLDGMTFYLDGAHTLESLQNCRLWFEKNAREEAEDIQCPVQRVLIFAITPDRDPARLLAPMKKYPFDMVMFPVHITDNEETSVDHQLPYPGIDELVKCAYLTKKAWDEMQLTSQENGAQKSIHCESIAESFTLLMEHRSRKLEDGQQTFLQILLTGSTSLLGKYLKFLDSVATTDE